LGGRSACKPEFLPYGIVKERKNGKAGRRGDG